MLLWHLLHPGVKCRRDYFNPFISRFWKTAKSFSMKLPVRQYGCDDKQEVTKVVPIVKRQRVASLPVTENGNQLHLSVADRRFYNKFSTGNEFYERYSRMTWHCMFELCDIQQWLTDWVTGRRHSVKGDSGSVPLKKCAWNKYECHSSSAFIQRHSYLGLYQTVLWYDFKK